MNVLHINLNFYESSLYESFSDSLIRQGCNLKVFYPTRKLDKNLSVPNYVYHDEILGKYDRYFFKHRNRKIVKYLNKQNISKNYDLLHAHSLFSNGFIAYTLNQQHGIPYIVAVRNTDLNHFFKKRILLRNLGIKILENAEKVIMLSEPYKEQLLATYIPKQLKKVIESKVEIIPNGIDDYWHQNIRREKNKYNINNDSVNILSVGVVNKRKNIRTSIDACEHLTNSGKDVKLTVIGSSTDEELLKSIKQYDFVNYIPRVDKEVLVEYYRNSHVFLMPSITETFGLVYAEAMSQGLPILYSKGQGFDEQFPDGTVGYAVEKMNPEDIANKILKVLANYNELSSNCVRLVDKFDWDKISKEYISLYESVIGD